jgi:hypothetical protein
MNGSRWLSLVLAVALLVNWPLALVARAQQPQQPDLYQEALKASAQPPEPGGGAYEIGAWIATAVNVPGRAILCTLSAGVSFAVLLISFGSGYRAAALVVEDGCRGPWILTADHLRGRRTAESMSRY